MKRKYDLDEEYFRTEEELPWDKKDKNIKVNKKIVKKIISAIVLIPTTYAAIGLFNPIEVGENNYDTSSCFIDSDGNLWVSEDDYNEYMNEFTEVVAVDCELVDKYCSLLPDTYVNGFYSADDGSLWISKRDYIEYVLASGVDLDSYIVNQKSLS